MKITLDLLPQQVKSKTEIDSEPIVETNVNEYDEYKWISNNNFKQLTSGSTSGKLIPKLFDETAVHTELVSDCGCKSQCDCKGNCDCRSECLCRADCTTLCGSNTDLV